MPGAVISLMEQFGRHQAFRALYFVVTAQVIRTGGMCWFEMIIDGMQQNSRGRRSYSFHANQNHPWGNSTLQDETF